MLGEEIIESHRVKIPNRDPAADRHGNLAELHLGKMYGIAGDVDYPHPPRTVVGIIACCQDLLHRALVRRNAGNMTGDI